MSKVYFIHAQEINAVKIGFSIHPEKRLANMLTSSPCALEILATFDGGPVEEKRLHKMFSKDRIRGEWFTATEKLFSLIDDAKKTGNLPGFKGFEERKRGLAVNDIRENRESLGWTQAQLADQLGVTHATVSRIESGDIPLNIRTLIALEVIFQRAAK